MLDITTIVLTYNEEIHIQRCLENVCKFSKRVVIVDSPSNDRTIDIINEFKCSTPVDIYVHKYPGNQAEQFNWALDNVNIDTEWILRVDADEYVTSELIAEMQKKLPSMSPKVSAVVLPLGRSFRGRLLKHSIVGSVKMIRLFRFGKVRYEQRLMDEHLEVLEGQTVTFENMFVDDNLMSIKAWTEKHNQYSNKEAAMLLDAELHLSDTSSGEKSDYAAEVEKKRAQKAKYARMPLYWRSFLYFIYRYIFKFGFLDGRAGFEWDFFQGLWYRMLIDAKVAEVKRACGSDKEKVREYILKNYNIKL